MTRKGKAQKANKLLIFCFVVDVAILAAVEKALSDLEPSAPQDAKE